MITKITSMLQPNILDITNSIIMIKVNMITDQITRYVLSRCRCANRGLWSGHDVDVDLPLKPTTNLTICSAAGLGRKTNLSSRANASQKPYSPSPGAGSWRQEVSETCSPVCRCTLVLGMEWTTKAAQQEGEANSRSLSHYRHLIKAFPI